MVAPQRALGPDYDRQLQGLDVHRHRVGVRGAGRTPTQVAPTGQAVRVMVRHVRVMVRHVYIVPSESSHVEYH